MPMPRFLQELIAEVARGRTTVDAAERVIATQTAVYVRPPSEDSDALIAWEDRMRELAKALTELNQVLSEDENPARIVGLGRIAAAAGRLFSASAEGKAAFTTAYRLFHLKSFKSALPNFERAAPLLAEDEPLLAAHAMSYQFDCLRQLKVFPNILKAAPKILDFARHHNFKGIEAWALLCVGAALFVCGDNKQGQQILTEALTLRLTLSPEICELERVPSEATFRHALATLASQIGDFQTALAELENARRIFTKEENADKLAATAAIVGLTWERVGEKERAIASFQLGDDSGIVTRELVFRDLQNAVDLLEAEPPQPAKSREIALQCIKEARLNNQLRKEAQARAVLAASYFEEHRFLEALVAQKATVRVVEHLGNDPLWEAQLRTTLGNILLSLGGWRAAQEAESQYRHALATVHDLRKFVSTTEMRQATTAGVVRIYEGLAYLLAENWKKEDGSFAERRLDELFKLVQEVHAVNVVGWLAAERQIELAEACSLMPKLLAVRSAEVHLEMVALSGKTELNDLGKVQEKVRKEFQEAASKTYHKITTDPPILAVGDVSRSLEVDECLLTFFTTAEGVVMMLVGPDGHLRGGFCRWHREKRYDFIKRWQVAIVDRSQGQISHISHLKARDLACASLLEELDQYFTNAVAGLFDRGQFPRKVYIVPHCELFQLPFWQMTIHAPDIHVSILPAPNVLGMLRDRNRLAGSKRMALGDMTGTLAYVPVEIGSLPGFIDLAGPMDEVIHKLADANFFHFAGHGQFNSKQPYLSGIVVGKAAPHKMGPFDSETKFGERLLTVACALGQLYLPQCFLTILSACSTGIPRIHAASESVGLPTAFLIAGSRNVIASLWPVHDAAACLLMKAFYDSLLSDDRVLNRPSAALAIARKKLSSMTRQAAVDQLGSERGIPETERPFAAAPYTMAFEHFGVD
jgi:tetratricopeptide (TPR) repeat protein